VQPFLTGLGMFVLFLALHTVLLNLFIVERKFRVVLGSFLGVGLLALGGLLRGRAWWDAAIWQTFAVYGCLFQGYLQFFFLAERGFSLRIVMEIARAGEQGLSRDELLGQYSEGKGLGWMLDKRLAHLEAARFVRVDGGWYVNIARGALAARAARLVRGVMKIPSLG